MGVFGFSKNMGIDLGTANTLVYVKGKGIVLREPSVVAVNMKTGEVLAAGSEAKAMLGRTPENINAIRPMKEGVIADYKITESMLKLFINKLCSKSTFAGPKIVICYPAGVTQVEKRAIEEAARSAGAREVHLMEEPMAAAIGAGLPVNEPIGNMIVDIGGGTTDIAIISLGGIVVSQSIRTAGDTMDNVIIAHIKRNYNVLIGERTAENIKRNFGVIVDKFVQEELQNCMEIKGRDLITGLPKKLSIGQNEIGEALLDPVEQIIECVKVALEKTPPELSADIMRTGITLAGGGALLKGIDNLINEKTGISVRVVENALDCVAVGAGKMLDHINK
jgi:rod shape-determining protein MreB and related proteins